MLLAVAISSAVLCAMTRNLAALSTVSYSTMLSWGFLPILPHVMLPSNNFRLGHGCSLLNTHELIAKGMRFTLEVAKDAITILLFIGVLTRVDILCAIAQ
jgi:hypothetical protein